MDYLKERLATKLKFDATRENMDDLVEKLDISADTLYIKVIGYKAIFHQ